MWDRIRKLFAATTEAKVRGYQPGRFSFNVKAAAFIEEFRAQWHGDAASAPSPANPAEAWPGGWPRVRG